MLGIPVSRSRPGREEFSRPHAHPAGSPAGANALSAKAPFAYEHRYRPSGATHGRCRDRVSATSRHRSTTRHTQSARSSAPVVIQSQM